MFINRFRTIVRFVFGKKKHWLYYVTPFTLVSLVVAIFCAIATCVEKDEIAEDEMWSGPGTDIFVCAIAMLLITDYLLKSATKRKVLYIWIIEMILVVTIVLWFRYYI